MARVTVEDCLEKFDNRFQLILESSKRARQLVKGAEPRVDWDNDKATVVALREIAEGHVGVADELEEQVQMEQAQIDEQSSQNHEANQTQGSVDPSDYFNE